jgi:hypothetical protein
MNVEVTPWAGQPGTFCRPLKVNVPEAPPGATLTTCPLCGVECWKLGHEPDPLPPHMAAGCTTCALKRGRSAPAKLKEAGKVKIGHPSQPERAQIEVLMDGGPLCVGPVWNWKEKVKVPGLFFIYFKEFGARIGPYYASISLAEKDMRKVLKAFPAKEFWKQPLEWYQRQTEFHEWITKNMGRPEDLVGGVWATE